MTKPSEEKMYRAGATALRRGKYPCGQTKLEGLFLCPGCQKTRWVDAHQIRLKCFTGLCCRCTGRKNVKRAQRPECKRCGPQNHNYKRGFWINHAGYAELTLPLRDPRRRFTNRSSGKILEHRLVMAQHLGRPLESWEQVHHINKKKTDNRLENLQLLSSAIHWIVTKLETEVAQLREENEKLKCQLAS